MSTYSDYSNVVSATTMSVELGAYVTGLTTPLSQTQIGKLETFITTIKAGLSITALSDTFDCIWMLAGETEESSLKNLVKNAHHCTNQHSTLFTAFEGFTGDATSDYLRTNYIPSSDAVRYALRDAGFGCYNRVNRAFSTAKIIMGANGSSAGYQMWIYPLYAAGLARTFTNSSNRGESSPVTSHGFHAGYRVDAINTLSQFNLSHFTRAANETGVTSREIYLLARNNDGSALSFTDDQIAFAFISKALSNTHSDILCNAVEAYMDSNGKGVI